MEERFENLRREAFPKAESEFETQTSLDPRDPALQIPCRICIYVATCEEEINWHLDDEHDVKTDMYFETDFPCEICGKWCRSEADLTFHLKNMSLVRMSVQRK